MNLGRSRGGETGDRSTLIFRTHTVGSPKPSAGQLDRIEETEEALEKAITIVRASFEMSRVPWMRPEDQTHMLGGLRKAGSQGCQGHQHPRAVAAARTPRSGLPFATRPSPDRLRAAAVSKPPNISNSHNDQDLVRARRVGHRHRYRVEMGE
jgi:hypothetical protein